MKTRVITGAMLLVTLLAVLLFCPHWVTSWVLAVMLAIGAYELLYSTGLVLHRRLVAYSMAAAFAVPLFCHYHVGNGWTILALLAYIGLLVGEMMLSHTKLPFDKVAISMVGGLVIPAALSSVGRILDGNGDLGEYLVVVPFILAFIPDTGAYFSGRFFGKHKLAPVISPKKTVEGAVGGLVTGVLCMLIYTLVMQFVFDLEVSYLNAVAYGLLGSLGSIFGDLSMSVIKRQTGIKDYGKLFPGHGGILDRFDSVLITAPLTEALLDVLPVVM